MRTDYIDPKTMWRVIDTLKPANALVMELCMETGLRVGDAVSLPFVALQGQTISFVAKKTGAYFVRPVSAFAPKYGRVFSFPLCQVQGGTHHTPNGLERRKALFARLGACGKRRAAQRAKGFRRGAYENRGRCRRSAGIATRGHRDNLALLSVRQTAFRDE